MIKSMTAYGQAKASANKYSIMAEIRGLNSKHLDINLNIPKEIYFLSPKIVSEVKKFVKRGRVDIIIRLEHSDFEQKVHFNFEIARKYLREIKKLEIQSQKEISVSLGDLISIQNSLKDDSENYQNFEVEIIKALRTSLEAFDKERKIEGKKLKEELEKRISLIDLELKNIEEAKDRINSELFKKMKSKVENIIGKIPEDLEGKLEFEIALMSEKQDITEEISRLKFHISRFKELLKGKAEGKALDFICQEMNRETNTIGSKLREISIINPVVNIKSEIARIREQVQNVE